MIQTQVNSAQVYTDLNALQGIRSLGKDDKSAALMEVAKQFESMFLNMMLSSMRNANKVFEEDSMFSSPEMDFYENMYDNQMALSLSGQQGMGLSDVIYRQLMQNYGDEQGAKPELDFSKMSDRQLSYSRPSAAALSQAVADVNQVLSDLAGQETQTSAAGGTQADAAALTSASTASGEGNKGQQFATPAEFVAALYPLAQDVGASIGVDPKAIVAQAALETGWGKYMITDDQGRNSFNFFGIKADARWSGDSVTVATHEYRDGVAVREQAAFRSYASAEEGLRDYASFLSSASRYDEALGQNLKASEYGMALQKAGYATDPQYGAKIHRISESSTLNDALNTLQLKLQGTGSDG
ncbi:flagellar assembly peptidoglycan hydrolase FlgJ [Thalassolituus sp. LLYu03]|uniref:flagellar assembly peptidoglycan hydrolase FlgJ n=1 Tax=Thalassolituus sp. LLYu03 TaxID=3421656 RepID=UPI003D267539